MVGLIRAFRGAVVSTLGDQWKDFLTVPQGVQPTAALFPAVPHGQGAGQGSSPTSPNAVISNGSKIVVPEGYGLITLEDGQISSFAADPGGYVWASDDINSQSVFAGDGIVDPLVRQSWARFQFGGRPTAQQLAFFVRLRELPNNRFGTQSEIYWDDSYLNTQVGAVARGTYTLRIVDPLAFVIDFVPATYLQNLETFDFTDSSNPAASQIFSEVVGSLAAAFSAYVNEPSRGRRIAEIQKDSIGFAKAMAEVVEDNYQWRTTRGLTIERVSLVAIEYDHASRELIKAVQRAEALSGARGDSNLQASVAAGLQAAGQTGGAAGLVGMGIVGNSMGLGALRQSGADDSVTAAPEGDDNLVRRLGQLKEAFDAGLITQQDYDLARAQALGI